MVHQDRDKEQLVEELGAEMFAKRVEAVQERSGGKTSGNCLQVTGISACAIDQPVSVCPTLSARLAVNYAHPGSAPGAVPDVVTIPQLIDLLIVRRRTRADRKEAVSVRVQPGHDAASAASRLPVLGDLKIHV